MTNDRVQKTLKQEDTLRCWDYGVPTLLGQTLLCLGHPSGTYSLCLFIWLFICIPYNKRLRQCIRALTRAGPPPTSLPSPSHPQGSAETFPSSRSFHEFLLPTPGPLRLTQCPLWLSIAPTPPAVEPSEAGSASCSHGPQSLVQRTPRS